jgi:hypothetical protein
VRQEASPKLLLFVYRFQRLLVYVGRNENNVPEFVSFDPNKISKETIIQNTAQNVYFPLFLNLTFPRSVPLLRYNAAGAEHVFRTRPFRILQAVLETISS